MALCAANSNAPFIGRTLRNAHGRGRRREKPGPHRLWRMHEMGLRVGGLADPARTSRSLEVVAGVGFEPTTFRL